jgi:DNA-binding CsgD family transcriptional regulator
VAALFVRQAKQDFPAAVASIAKIYELTDAQTRVLHVILDTGSATTAALSLRLSENTVKTHMRHILRKTNARNQIDLLKLAAALSSPLAHSSDRAAPAR